MKLIVDVTIILFALTKYSKGSFFSDLRRCERNPECNKELQTVYYGHCANLFDSNRNNTDKIQCTDECRKSLEEWKEPTNPYNKFAKVKCGFSERCLTHKNRFKRCVNKKIRPILHKNYLPNGCVKFYQGCKKDSKCKLALNDFSAGCNELINGYECTTRCKDALRNLESATVGESLTSCQCDGASPAEGNCLGIKRNIKKLCKT